MSNQTTTTTPAVDYSNLGLWQGLMLILGSVVKISVRTATTADKTIALVENEVDMLHEEQHDRLKRIEDDRIARKAALEADS